MTRPATVPVPVITSGEIPGETTEIVIPPTSAETVPGESTGTRPTPVVPVTCVYAPSTSSTYKPITTTTIQPPTSRTYTPSTSSTSTSTSRVSKLLDIVFLYPWV